MRFLSRLTAVLLLLCAFPAFAQTTATLTGNVTSEGSALPGATVTVTSPALQGSRSAVTGPNGEYNFPALPPGTYTVTVELEGLQTVRKNATVRLGETARADVDLKVSAVAEAITVTAAAPSVLETTQVSTSLTAEQVESLPLGRTIAQRILIAPGVNDAGPNNQRVINGAPSYDNLYMVNGVVVNDTLRGQPENLFVEDAIQETTLITGGVSAEYGRFTGGVVNTITKSGGNEFSGSLRNNLTNGSWTDETAFRNPVTGVAQPDNADVLNEQWEATLGGYLMKDRIWFFGAGRMFEETQSNVTTLTTLPYEFGRDNKRYEAKLTGQIAAGHSIVGSYLKNNTTETNYRFGNVVDLRSLTNRELPNWLQSYQYTGVITSSFLVEAQYSRRYFGFIGGGGPKDLVDGTILRDNNTSNRMWSPTFCGECDPKTRNNKNYLVKANYFLTSSALGSHNISAGYDDFHELRNENNYQSGSNFRIFGDFSKPINNEVFISVLPNDGRILWTPLFQLSQTNDFATKSVFLNDKWDFNKNFSFNVGVRWDKNDGKDQSGNKVADDSAFSPRLGVIYDVRGDGRDRISASYSHYVTKLDSGIGDSASAAGTAASIYYNYNGPALNPVDASGNIIGTPLSNAEVITRVFDWFRSVGGEGVYGDVVAASIPGLTARIDGTLKSPVMKEIALGYGHQFGGNGYARVDFINRNWSDFYVTRLDQGTGKATDQFNKTYDVGLVGNDSGDLERTYNGIQLQGQYSWLGIQFGGNYTWSKLRGNIEGETYNNATVTDTTLVYPEFRDFEQARPVGYLQGDLRHRANLYANYDWKLPFGTLNLGLLQRYQSAASFSAIGNVDARKANWNAFFGTTTPPTFNYITPPDGSATAVIPYYFAERGAYRLDDITSTDLSALYTFPIYKSVSVFVRGELINSFNEQGVQFASTNLGPVVEQRVYTSRNRASLKPFNPRTETPVLGTHYELDTNFGKATNKDAYQLPRTYRFAVGFRF
ncbi:MAG TPA: TonB-dependent receptor [Thermoanaerobaculia bacterium]